MMYVIAGMLWAFQKVAMRAWLILFPLWLLYATRSWETVFGILVWAFLGVYWKNAQIGGYEKKSHEWAVKIVRFLHKFNLTQGWDFFRFRTHELFRAWELFLVFLVFNFIFGIIHFLY
jgi:hypothetical protein